MDWKPVLTAGVFSALQCFRLCWTNTYNLVHICECDGSVGDVHSSVLDPRPALPPGACTTDDTFHGVSTWQADRESSVTRRCGSLALFVGQRIGE